MAESKKSKKSTKKAPGKSESSPKQGEVVKPEAKMEALQRTLESLNIGIEEKKLALIELAHLGTSGANEVIQDFIFGLEGIEVNELKEWAKIALDEGEYLASVPTSPEEEEKMIKEAVYQDYMDRYCDLEAKIEDVEEEIAERKYEYEVVKRLKKKAKTKQAKEDWNIEEMVQHDLLVMEEGRKEQLEGELRIVEAIMDEIESELKNKL